MGDGQGGNEGRRDREDHQAGLQGEWTNSGRIGPRAAQMRCVVETGIAAAVFYYAVHDYLPWRASGTRLRGYYAPQGLDSNRHTHAALPI